MKKFFEEYGFTILASIIVILLIVMATPIGSLIRSNVSHIVESFGEKTTQKLDYAMREYQAKDVIEVAGKKLTIMENLGNDKYLVLAEKYKTIPFNNCDGEKLNGKCNGELINNYVGSNIDKELSENYYNSLPETIKNAIVEQNISQDDYSNSSWQGNNIQYDYVHNSPTAIAENQKCKDNWCARKDNNSPWQHWKDYEAVSGKQGAYILTNVKSISENIGNRKIFLPSLKELSSIVNVNDQKEMEDFLKTKSPYPTAYHMWLRDKYGSFALYAYYSSRSLNDYYVWNAYLSVRPAFVLDLSKIGYEKVN